MKKLLAIVLTLTMICAFLAACGPKGGETETSDASTTESTTTKPDDTSKDTQPDNKEPESITEIGGKSVKDIYDQMYKAISEATDYELKGTLKTKTTLGADTSNMTHNEVYRVTADKAYIMSTEGGVNTEYWFNEGYAFTKDVESKTKESTTLQGFIDTYIGSPIDVLSLIDSKHLDLSDNVFTKKGNNYALALDISDEEMTSFLEELGIASVVTSAKYSFNIDFDANGNVTRIAYVSDTEMTMMEMQVKVEENATFDVKLGGTTVTIPADDPASFTDVTTNVPPTPDDPSDDPSTPDAPTGGLSAILGETGTPDGIDKINWSDIIKPAS